MYCINGIKKELGINLYRYKLNDDLIHQKPYLEDISKYN
jgi:hypothetical protein